MLQSALFHPKALEAIRSFPKIAKHEIGEAILELPKGSRLTMPLSLRVGDRGCSLRIGWLGGRDRALSDGSIRPRVAPNDAIQKRTLGARGAPVKQKPFPILTLPEPLV